MDGRTGVKSMQVVFFQPPISPQFHLKIVQSGVILKALLCTVPLGFVPRTFRNKKRRQMVPDQTPELSTPRAVSESRLHPSIFLLTPEFK